ncbi:MAG: hypothetical protein AAFV38_08785 [Pseudomonadota bacterium]
MAAQAFWREETSEPTTAPHPKLEPVSGWLFRRQSPFLSAGGFTPEGTGLFAMPIDAAGFDPTKENVWRAWSVKETIKAGQEHYFTVELLQDHLDGFAKDITNTSVYVIPFPLSSIREDIATGRESLRHSPHLTLRPLSGTPPKRIIGVIDHGINLFHRRFRMRNGGTRILSAWVQNANWQEKPSGLPFGQDWSRPDLDTGMQHKGADQDDQLRHLEKSYGQHGFRPLSSPISHGTHVLDLAAGLEPNDPAANDTAIVAVQLPPEVTRETSGSMLALPLIMGLEYILERARAEMTDGPIPVFVNLSFGMTGGPRNGMHRIERSIERMARAHVETVRAQHPDAGTIPKPKVVMAAGNRNMARGHAAAPMNQSTLKLTWHLQPGDPSANFLEIRFELADFSSTGSVIFEVTPPGRAAAQLKRFEIGQNAIEPKAFLLELGGEVIGRASVIHEPRQPAVLTLALAQTDPGTTGRPVAPSGDWQIKAWVDGAPVHRIDAWILRDDVPAGFRDTGRQSYFVDADYAARDERGFPIAEDPPTRRGTIKRSGTVNALSTSPAKEEDPVIWSVGAYRGRDASAADAAPYSASPDQPSTEHVDRSAQGDRSNVLRGVRAAGTRSGTRAALSGTSVAAPQVVRQLALDETTWHDVPTQKQQRMGQKSLAPRIEKGAT